MNSPPKETKKKTPNFFFFFDLDRFIASSDGQFLLNVLFVDLGLVGPIAVQDPWHDPPFHAILLVHGAQAKRVRDINIASRCIDHHPNVCIINMNVSAGFL
jgi:hypothetical protein